jgi:hypothetical protein
MLDDGSVGRATATLRSVEVLVRGRGGGISGRFAKGLFSPPLGIPGYRDLVVGDAKVLLGPRPFTVELGYHRRAHENELFGNVGEHLARAGVRSLISLGPSGLSVSFAGAALLRQDSTATSDKKVGVGGWELETGVLYQAPRRLPFYATAGYRFERFAAANKVAPLAGRREETSQVFVEAGFRFIR